MEDFTAICILCWGSSDYLPIRSHLHSFNPIQSRWRWFHVNQLNLVHYQISPQKFVEKPLPWGFALPQFRYKRDVTRSNQSNLGHFPLNHDHRRKVCLLPKTRFGFLKVSKGDESSPRILQYVKWYDMNSARKDISSWLHTVIIHHHHGWTPVSHGKRPKGILWKPTTGHRWFPTGHPCSIDFSVLSFELVKKLQVDSASG